MTRYELYKKASYDWLKNIPFHWEELFLEQVAQEKLKKNSNNDISKVLSLSYGSIKVKKDLNKGLISKDLSTYQIVEPGDIIMRLTDLQNDHKSLRTGLVNDKGIITAAYLCLSPKINSRYLHYLLHSYDTLKVFYGMGGGVRQSIGFKDIRHMYLPVPPRTEQEQIVRFLDWKVSEINKLIGIERGKIQNLEELKNKAIDKAVLHGLKPQKEKLNEDIRWEISYPSSWKIERLRNIFSFRKGLSITKANLEPNGIEVINYGQIHSKKNTMVSLNEDLFKYVNESYLETDAASLVKKGDFIFADTSEDLEGCGNCAYIDRCGEIFAGYHTVIAHPKERTNNKYFAYLFKSSVWRYQLRKKVNAVKVYSITQQILKDVFLFVPSELEQVQIVEHLDKLCYQIDEFISTAKKKINELEDMKAVVISDVVTGKIDVRNVEIPEYEHIDDVVDDGDDKENEEELADAEETEA